MSLFDGSVGTVELGRVEMPASPKPPRVEVIPANQELVDRARGILPRMPDEVTTTEVLAALGMPSHACTAWHHSRVIDALIGPGGEWTAHLDGTATGKVRYRRRPT